MRIYIIFLHCLLISNVGYSKDGILREISIEYEKDIKLVLNMEKFNSSQHEVTSCGKESICLIDGYPFFGTDGQTPKTKLSHFYVEINGYPIHLNTSGMYDPWVVFEGKDYVSKDNFSISKKWGNNWVVRGNFSDGAGAYQAEWLITEGKSIRTLINSSDAVADYCLEVLN